MSWSASGTAGEHGIAVTSFTLASPPYQGASAEVREAMELAAEVATKAIQSGALGGPGKTYTVSCSGHANPEHEPKAGWVNDCLTVSVMQLSPKPEE